MSLLITKSAPDFEAKAINSQDDIVTIRLSDYITRCNVLLFFYPLNFTFVCPTEIISLHNRIDKFESLNTKVFGISTDSHYSHLAWRNMEPRVGGIGKVNFTLISDIQKKISKSYGVLVNSAIALRAAYFIDKSGIVRHATINDLPIGRNVDELVRVIEAWQYHEENGEVCPAGWQKGEAGITTNNKDSLKDYLQSHEEDL